MSRSRLVLLSLIVGCGIENNVDRDLEANGVANPPDLDDPVKVDRILQTTTPSVDVMWAIDTSCSMSCVVGCHGTIADKVVENFPKFTDYFVGSGLDYHIGVITMDLEAPESSGKLQYGLGQKFIDNSTADPKSAFFEMTRPGTDGSGTERGIGAAYTAIELLDETFNGGFYREDASLHTIALSNENDQTPGSLITRAEFVDWYDDLKPQNEDRTFSSIVCLTRDSEECRDAVGSIYSETTHDIGGILWDITSDDWAGLLDQLGAQAAGLKREYFLSEIPVPETVEVGILTASGGTLEFERAEGDPPVGDWTYSTTRNSITFLEFTPEALSQVVISYTIASAVN